MKKRIMIAALLGAALFFAFGGMIKDPGLQSVFHLGAGNAPVSVVIDPGHGGIDGGAQSRGGILEKDINLQIALQLRELAWEAGWEVKMTREEDRGLYEEGKSSIRSKKIQDLKARRDMINASGADAAVSIHLNSYPSQEVQGAQTFYSASSPEGKQIAQRIQETIRLRLDPENERQPMSKDDIAIMKDNPLPLVLVECGFLSSDREAALLSKASYQRELAACMFSALKEYFMETGRIVKEEMQICDSLGQMS